MRILVDQPSEVPARGYRRFLQRSQLCGLMADHLAAGEPYLALNGVVLEREESQRLRWLTETFVRVFHKAGVSLARDVPRLVEMGFPWVAAELLSAEAPRVPLVGRFDFMMDDEGHWRLLEFNADTPSGTREAMVADRLVYEAIAQAACLRRPNKALGDTLIDAFTSALRGMPEGRALGLVTDAEELEDVAQMAFTQTLLSPVLATSGTEVVLGDYDNLVATRSGLTLCGRPIGALYRYVPFESMLGTPQFAAIYNTAMSGRLRLLNGFYGLLLQHKGLMSWLWRHRDDRAWDQDEKEAVSMHLPPTWDIQDLPTGVEQRALVAKQVFGREGEEVRFGEDVSPQEWALLQGQRTYVAQRRVSSPRMTAAVPTADGIMQQQGYLTVGCYVVEGRWAGYYTRYGGKVITSRAKWMATFEDGGGPAS